MRTFTAHVTNTVHWFVDRAGIAALGRAGELLLCDCDEAHISAACAASGAD